MELRLTVALSLAKGWSEMSATREFFQNWLQENVGTLPGREEVSVAVLAQQFEQDAEVAGYGREVREDELGNIEDAIVQAIENAGSGVQSPSSETSDPAPVMDALEVDDAKSGP
ncbi:DUF768 domain-containing protein [Mesorhizobium sp. C416B]|uniref:DUF768 domain-containing protein n=1 Tax=unclassified Mesorhizobium TaxID=325217 RepID=UPI0003CE7C83|nr:MULTISPECIES: DUF768 domain-containing protein [unclassified Mesorhizobium]ESX46163.1 hypothetical protein X762_24060 [Mesorhizobium sp. LSHC426A00]ESX54797.1 hypothetical protein X761_15035 [Mesorhizobium sp. LSHC424B00]ESX69063.1 hypothetical protein X758_19840 [Mesorhizobium sp. LSHC416B00]WJI62329.1 DUF768 domain-containing protein [Mesorhizobium sp. C416B]